MFKIDGYEFNTLDELNEFLIKAAEAYYNGEMIIADHVFDSMQAYYERKSGKEFQVGAKVTIGRTVDLAHSYKDFAGTLKKVKNIQELGKWYEKVGLSESEKVYASLKADGHSITVEVINVKGKPVIDKALTRGKDGKGKDLTSIFKANEKSLNLPNLKADYAIGYEAVVTTENFEQFTQDHGELYKSPRSMIGGVMSEDGSVYFKYLSLIGLRIKLKDGWLTRSEQVKILNKYNYDNVGFEDYFEEYDDILELAETYRNVTEARFDLGIMCDGIVIEVFDEDLRQELGYADTHPHFAVALKFPPAAKETTVTGITWSTEGNSGRHTPMVHFKAVKIVGITYKKVSLANYDRFKLLGLKIGDKVQFTRNNDVLGYVSSLACEENENNPNPVVEPITHCLECESELVINGAFLECVDSSCPLNALGNILQFIDKMDIKFIGRKTIEKLYDEKVISAFVDLFNLTKKDFIKITEIDGLGNSVVTLIKDMVSLLSKEGVLDYKFMAGFNIPLLGRDRWKMILNTINLNDFLDLLDSDQKALRKNLLEIEGIGDITVDAIINALAYGGTRRDELDEFLLTPIKIMSSKTNKSFLQKENSLSFCITGSSEPFSTRSAVEDFIQSYGHKLVSGVSKKTNYLITNDKTSGTSKNTKAESLGIPILSVQELKDMLESEEV